jgi:polyadenylate-binding protein
MNGKIIASKPIYVALAQRKEQRRQQLQNQMEQRVQQSRMQNAGPGGMPGMYPPQGPAVFYPMQGGGRGGNNMAYYQPQMGGQMGGQRRFPQQPGAKGGQQGYPGNPQGYMVQNQGGAPRQNRQGRQGGKGQQGRQQAQKGGKGDQGQKGGGRGPQYQQGARPAPAPAPAPAPTPAAPVQQPTASGDFAAQLAAVPAEQQKMLLGERLFPLISEHEGVGDQAGKITGMLLDMDTHELLHLIESPDALTQKVTEAINVLIQHQIMETPSQ